MKILFSWIVEYIRLLMPFLQLRAAPGWLQSNNDAKEFSFEYGSHVPARLIAVTTFIKTFHNFSRDRQKDAFASVLIVYLLIGVF